MNPAIVVNAYNRPEALARLLRSIGRAAYVPEAAVPLVISIDAAGRHPAVNAVAESFAWEYGPKEIVYRAEPLGLLGHFYACGDLATAYGAIVYLEDDLTVSRAFYHYACQALEFYGGDSRIAGVSLYGLWFNGYTHLPFVPYLEDADAFFMQLPYTQGEAFTAAGWSAFRAWQRSGGEHERLTMPFHRAWSRFDSNDWFPALVRYLVACDRYFVFPRASLSTGYGDAGTHFAGISGFFQVSLLHDRDRFHFKPLDSANAVYDSFFEMSSERLRRLGAALGDLDCTVDLNATRAPCDIMTERVLTTRPCRAAIRTYGLAEWPPEANVVEGVAGLGISLCRRADLRWGRLADLQTRQRLRAYYAHGQPPGLREWLRGVVARRWAG